MESDNRHERGLEGEGRQGIPGHVSDSHGMRLTQASQNDMFYIHFWRYRLEA